MMNHVLTAAVPGQPILSDRVRTIVKKVASVSGGLREFVLDLGLPYKRVWEQMNRCQGVRVDLLPALTAVGLDEPLRVIADACGYDVTPKAQFLRKKLARPKPVRSHALAIHHAAAAVTMKIEEALADSTIDERERETIKAAIHRARIALAELEGRLMKKDGD